MSGRVAFIESNTTGTGTLFLRRTRELGLTPVLITADPSRYDLDGVDRVEVVVADTGDLAAVEEALARSGGRSRVAAILSSSEYYVEAAAELAQRYGLRGPDPVAVAGCRDKRLQHRALVAAGVPTAEQVAVHTEEQARAAGRRLGYPVVCKPADGSGSVGVRLCHNPDELQAHARCLLERQTNKRGVAVDPVALVESYLGGREYSVEFVGGAEIGVVAKHLGPEPNFVEVGHDFPARLEARQLQELRRVAFAAVEALDLGGAPAVHLEARIEGEVARVVEVNPRLAGGCIPVLIAYAGGLEPIAATVKAAIGPCRPAAPAPARHASLRFLLVERLSVVDAEPTVGRLARAAGVVEARAYRRPGTRVAPSGDFRDRVGHAIACARLSRQARAACGWQVRGMAKTLVPAPTR